jgi:hypothetical protein
MASYKHQHYLDHSDSSEFDKIYKPGQATPFSGIYRCESCKVEVVSEEGKPLPPTNANHPHSTEVRWKMIVYAQHKGS